MFLDTSINKNSSIDPNKEHGPGYGGPHFPEAGNENAPYCHFVYFPNANAVYLDQSYVNYSQNPLYNWLPSAVVGSGSPLINPACTIYPASSSVHGAGPNDVSIDLDIQFASGNGTYYMYELAVDAQGSPSWATATLAWGS